MSAVRIEPRSATREGREPRERRDHALSQPRDRSVDAVSGALCNPFPKSSADRQYLPIAAPFRI
jgi:hypothetical protein